MPLGANKWAVARPYYDSLTLESNGDEVEQKASAYYAELSQLFPNYRRFWRYHVCPATNRPNAITMRPRAAHIVSTITQRSYSVFRNTALALNFLGKLKAGEPGEFDSHFDSTIKNAGDSLQVATDLQCAICGPEEKLDGMLPLSVQMGVVINPFPDWKSNFKSAREEAARYRNYLTHQGKAYSVRISATRQTLVLKQSAYTGNTFSWTQADEHYDRCPSDWIDRTDACAEVIADTLAFLDLSYDRICSSLDPHVDTPKYQRLWGWRDGINPIERSQPNASENGGCSLIAITGSTSTRIEDQLTAPPSGSRLI